MCAIAGAGVAPADQTRLLVARSNGRMHKTEELHHLTDSAPLCVVKRNDEVRPQPAKSAAGGYFSAWLQIRSQDLQLPRVLS